MKKIMIIGASGMLGSTLFRFFAQQSTLKVYGTLRSRQSLQYFTNAQHTQLYTDIDVLNWDSLVDVIAKVSPDVIINCVGLIKQLAIANDPLQVLPINALLPHRLAKLSAVAKARFIHISTDCVFNGRRGRYQETDISDAEDLYGKSKFIGEVIERPHAITLRTSIIGHELNSHIALIDWFLAQQAPINGFTQAIYSGLPTIELAQIILEYVLPNPKLSGLYHVASKPIDKYTLLQLVAEIYDKTIDITPCDKLKLDRSLDATRFQAHTGYSPPTWRELIVKMKEFARF
ncbi:MAG TPA: NAD(P)-dependent oxidoreductase [Legionellales bacterium]|nr:NAD(P)-dependent oxidoreductase [Legionellales bacterium]HCA89407.1 NAD(P)-dependent oxidoreductase [Legionellales bacterium]|tara:strand:+ start:2504 stop:3370 length:867 start_codon:yes stop_codon:yes gene_type:complete